MMAVEIGNFLHSGVEIERLASLLGLRKRFTKYDLLTIFEEMNDNMK
jgi:hypothetical protein